MKKLHKTGIAIASALAPAAALGVTAGVVASVLLNKTDMVDMNKPYTPTIAPYTPKTEEAEGVDADKALEIYLENCVKNPKILVQDYFVTNCHAEPTAFSDLQGFKINKIDKVNQTIDFEFNEHIWGKDDEYDRDETYSIKVTNAKIQLNNFSSNENNWDIAIGQDDEVSELGDEVITGSISGYLIVDDGGEKMEINYTGKEITINKDSQEPTEGSQEYIEFVSLFHYACISDITSYYLQNLKYKE